MSTRPISAGDMCRVISGYTGAASPNIGLIVEVIHRVYECPQLGIIWRCQAEFAVRDRADRSLVPGGLADFSQDWLKRIEPDALPAKVLEKAESA
jgi:predicted RNA-binding Zn-ribbon protein involved in translation (DUF1610 family)